MLFIIIANERDRSVTVRQRASDAMFLESAIFIVCRVRDGRVLGEDSLCGAGRAWIDKPTRKSLGEPEFQTVHRPVV